jgi:hypothetical protein
MQLQLKSQSIEFIRIFPVPFSGGFKFANGTEHTGIVRQHELGRFPSLTSYSIVPVVVMYVDVLYYEMRSERHHPSAVLFMAVASRLWKGRR